MVYSYHLDSDGVEVRDRGERETIGRLFLCEFDVVLTVHRR